jgi:hypothetical protein
MPAQAVVVAVPIAPAKRQAGQAVVRRRKLAALVVQPVVA